MENQAFVFEELLIENIEIFKNSFLNISKNVFYDKQNNKYTHPGEYGIYREAICKRFLRFFLPNKFDIHNGFLINSYNDRSTQCDVIIYDRNSTPFIQAADFQRFFPVETVVAVGEIKSTLSKSDFKDTLNKLAAIKKLRSKSGSQNYIFRDTEDGRIYPDTYSPDVFEKDNLLSFLICQKLDFDLSNISNEINGYYDADIENFNRHNLILSIEDGVLVYYDDNGVSLMYPTIRGVKLRNRFTIPGENKFIHFKCFMHYLFMGVCSTTILYPETKNYIGTMSGGFNQNEK